MVNQFDVEKILESSVLSATDAEALLTTQDPEMRGLISQAADLRRREQVGDLVTYVINRNINFTNICEQHCSFCAFRRNENENGAFWLNSEEIIAKAQEAVNLGATEICMQGGLNPQAKLDGSSLKYYQKLLFSIKETFPDLHLHAFSPQEIQFIAREDGLSYEKVIATLQEAGLGSMPGTAAEVLDDGIRKIICPEKINTATWLEIISTAHRLGISTTSTMLSGHVEKPHHQVSHWLLLLKVQQIALERGYGGKITEFILLPFVGEEAPLPMRRRVGNPQPILEDALLSTAVARLVLGKWILNHQPSWVKLGLVGAQKALLGGCNDLGGTLMEEHITTMAGAKGGTAMTVENLQKAIESLNRPQAQRNTLYELVTKPVSPL